MSAGKLYYFPIHGKAAPMAMLMKHAKVEFEFIPVTQAQWPEMKDTMPGKQMPAW
jgi:hypothetical protein